MSNITSDDIQPDALGRNETGDGTAIPTAAAPDPASEANIDSCLPRRTPSRFGRFVALILSCLGITLVSKVLYNNYEIIESIVAGRTSWSPLAVASFCLLGNQIVCICRWTIFMRAVGGDLSSRSYIDLAVTAEAANFAIPGSNGGDVVKFGALMRQSSGATRVAASIIADRMTGLLGLLIVGSLAGGFAWSSRLPHIRQITVVTVVILCVAILGSVAVLGPMRRLVLQFVPRGWAWLDRLLAKLDEAVVAFHCHPRVLGWGLLMSIFGQSMTLTAIFQIGVALNPNNHASWGTTLLAGPWVLISTALPLPFGALGVTEMFSDELFRALGHGGGGITALIFRLLQLFSTSMLIFGWLAIRQRIQVSR